MPTGAFEAPAVAGAAMQQGPDFVSMVQVPDMEAYQSLVRRLLAGDARAGADRTGPTNRRLERRSADAFWRRKLMTGGGEWRRG